MEELRPDSWDQYIGQKKMKKRLLVHINGALNRMERLDHILLAGPPGTGKTSLAQLIAKEACMPMVQLEPPIKTQLIKKIVLSHSGILFIDEIHRMKKPEQEQLLPLLEDGFFRDPNNGLQLHNDFLTIIGATTEPESLETPLYDRFTIKPPFEDYSERDMARIIQGMAQKMGFEIPRGTAKQLAKATGGTPRQAKSLVSMARDLGSLNANEILDMCGYTPDGYTEQQVAYLRFITDMGGVAGLDNLSTHLQIPVAVIKSEVERLLMKRKCIEVGPKGRSITANGYKVLGNKVQ